MSERTMEQALKLVKSSRRQVARMLKTVGRDCEYSESLLNPIHRELKQAQKSLESLAQQECLAIELAEAIGIDPSYEGITEFLSRRVVRMETVEVKERYDLWGYDPKSDELTLLLNNKSRRECETLAETTGHICRLATTSGKCVKWFF